MSTTSTQDPQKPKERLTTGQMLHLMRLEVERALRHEYPISLMALGLDGYAREADVEPRRQLMRAVFGELKKVTFENDVRGMGVFTPHYVLAVFPHVRPALLSNLARQMLERARGIEPVGGVEQVTLSSGIAHNLQHEGEITFESLVEEAETGMQLAAAAGGDRFLLARDVEDEIDRLREELDSKIEELGAAHAAAQGAEAGVEGWGRNLTERVVELFQREEKPTESVLRLEKELIALIHVELEEWKESSSVKALLDGARTVDMLERRVAKLNASLGSTEAELKRVAAMKNIDLGVSSIYRDVQGLSDDDDNAEAKGAMLKDIFDANVALQAASKS